MPGSPGSGAPGEELVSLTDPSADHGDGPDYADLAQVSLHEQDGRVRMHVTLARAVPRRLRAREAQAVGIDLFRTSSDHGDFQVLLDGGRGGWRAFLHTPDGYVDFPGLFSVDGRNLRVDLPWDAIGGRDAAEVSAFVEWSFGIDRLATDGTLRVDLPIE